MQLDGIKDKWNQFKEWLATEEGQQTEKTVKGYAKAVWDAEKELVKGSITAAQDIVHWGGAFLGGALNTPGGVFRPVDMIRNALAAGNLSLQDAEILKNAGWDKYFGTMPTIDPAVQTKGSTFTGTTINVYSSQSISDIISGLDETLSNESGYVINMVQ